MKPQQDDVDYIPRDVHFETLPAQETASIELGEPEVQACTPTTIVEGDLDVVTSPYADRRDVQNSVPDSGLLEESADPRASEPQAIESAVDESTQASPQSDAAKQMKTGLQSMVGNAVDLCHHVC